MLQTGLRLAAQLYLPHWRSEVGVVPGIYGSEGFYTGLFNAPLIELLMTRLVFSSSGNKQSDAGRQTFLSLIPLSCFNCFLSCISGKQRVSSWQTSTTLQVCRQLEKPLWFGVIPRSCSAEGRRVAVLFNQRRRWKLPCVTDALRQSKMSQEKIRVSVTLPHIRPGSPLRAASVMWTWAGDPGPAVISWKQPVQGKRMQMQP